jgi:hypothetical protein
MRECVCVRPRQRVRAMCLTVLILVNANLKGFIHGDCVVRTFAGRRLFGACAPGIEMAGTAAVCVF